MKPEGVRLGRRPGTPEVLEQDDFRGLVLNTPQSNLFVVPSADVLAWVHGGLKLDAGQLGQGDAYLGLLTMVLVNETTLETHTSKILGDYLPGPPFDPTAFDWTGRTVIDCFHVELGAFFGVEAVDANHVVRAVLGPWVSNALRIRVRVQR